MVLPTAPIYMHAYVHNSPLSHADEYGLWRVEGSFQNRTGVWELVVNPKTKIICHFNFVGKK